MRGSLPCCSARWRSVTRSHARGYHWWSTPGLYLALLLKRQDASHSVSVVEQNPADATFGFGVVFSQRALRFLRDADPSSHAEIESRACGRGPIRQSCTATRRCASMG